MDLFRTRKDGRVFKISGSNGQIQTPIRTPAHHDTAQEHKIRSTLNLIARNKYIRESHEDRVRIKKLQNAEKRKIEEQRKKQRDELKSDYEKLKQQLRDADRDPRILDEIRKQSFDVGALPRDQQKSIEKEKAKYISKQHEKIKSEESKAQENLEQARRQTNENNNKLSELKKKAEEIRKRSSNIPEINQQNTNELNKITIEIADLEGSNDSLAETINGQVETIRALQKEKGLLNFVNKDNSTTAFGTVGNLPDRNRDTLPKDTLDKRKRAQESYERRTTGKGTTPIFPEGFEHKRKVRNPLTGQYFYTNKLPSNEKFVGFNEDSEPVFVDPEHKLPRPESFHISGSPVDIPSPRNDSENLDRGQQLRGIVGLAKGVE